MNDEPTNAEQLLQRRIEELETENHQLRGECDMLFTRAAKRLAAIKELQVVLEARDAEIKRLYAACKRLSENEQYKHRLWVQAMQETDTVRRMAALESILNLPTVGWSADSEN